MGHDDTPNDYRFDHPTISMVMQDMFIPARDPGPGDQIAAFDLETISGERLSSDALRVEGRPVLLVFGSLTCPVTESAAAGLNDLYAIHGDAVRFLMVNVREAHPGQSLAQPRTIEEKRSHAEQLKRRHRIPFEVAVDGIDGALHRALGPRPNSAFVIGPSGRILFRAQWANQTAAIGKALHAIAAGATPPAPAVSRTLPAITRSIGYIDPVLDAAGKGAWFDLWRIAAPMGVVATLSRLFFFLPRGQRGLPTIATLALLLVAGAWAATGYRW